MIKIESFGFSKTRTLLNNQIIKMIMLVVLLKKTFWYVNCRNEEKYQCLIKKTNQLTLKSLKKVVWKIFIEFSNNIQNAYKNIEEYNSKRKRKVLLVFDNMIGDMINNKNFNHMVAELFIRGKNVWIFLVLVTKSYLAVPKDVRLSSTHFYDN